MILTPDRRLRVFISSTLDLRDERAAAKRAVESLELTPVMFEAGARPHPPRALYRSYVEQSDVFVAIYSRRYGWTAPDMEISGLEDEYNVSAGIPRLVYIDAGVEREPELDRFLERVRDDGLSYRPFTGADELETLLKHDLVVLLTERFHDAAETPATRGAPPPAPLPMLPTRLVGREAELAAIGERLGRDESRLVTLLGPGGIGKTSLAIAAAHRFASRFPGGAFFVPLADVAHPDLIGQAVASALGLPSSDASSPVAPIAEFMRDRRALLVLDNFEHLLAGAPTVAQLLACCPELTVVVTSRAALRLRDERELEVGPLAVPASVPGSAAPDAFPAVQLFVDAARAVRPAFAMDERSGAAVAEVCRLLDGLPLAIELAAAMVRILTPDMLLQRLRERPTDLGSGARDMPERHQTLRATISWSYELLDDVAKALFAQLSVFRGGFTLERAEQICDVDDVVSVLAVLAEHSLIRTEVHCGCGARFSMLGTIRDFAIEQLEARPGAAELRYRHARVFVELVETVDGRGGHDAATLDAVEVDLDNVRQAFEWLLAAGESAPVATAIGRSWWLWWMRGYVIEGKMWADRCLAEGDLSEMPRAHALLARAMFAMWSGEYETAVPAFAEAAQCDDRRTVAYADTGAGLIRAMTTSVTEGRGLIERGVAAFEELGDDAGVSREFDDDEGALRHALHRVRAHGSEMDVGTVEAALAQLLMRDGPEAEVADLLASSLERFAGARDIGSTILTLEVIAELALGVAAVREATVALAATAAIRHNMGTRVPPVVAARLERLVAHARQSLGDEFDTAFSLGSGMGYAEAVDRGRALLRLLRRGE